MKDETLLGKAFNLKPLGWKVEYKTPSWQEQRRMAANKECGWKNFKGDPAQITEENCIKDGSMHFSVRQAYLFKNGPEAAARYFTKQMIKNGCTDVRCYPYYDE